MPPGASAWFMPRRHPMASSVSVRCAAVPRRTHATSKPVNKTRRQQTDCPYVK